MATIKISALPEVTTLATTDLLTAVASNVSSKITVESLSNTLTQVSSSISSSYAITASYALNAGGGGGSSFPYTGSAKITGSLSVTGSIYVLNGGVTSSLFGTASWANNATTSATASYVVLSQTASYVVTSQTASYVQTAQTASYVTLAQTASYVETAQTASYVVTAQTASYVVTAQSASYANPLTQIVIITGSIRISGSSAATLIGSASIVSGSLAVGNITPSATVGRIDASNDVVAFSTSDQRLKTEVSNISDPITKINSINGVNFTWIENPDVHGNSGRDVGVIAQEIEQVLPEVVTTRDNGYKAVKYEKIVPLLIEAIKELQKQIDELKSK